MSRMMLGFQIFFTLVGFLGIMVNADPMDRCMRMVNLEQELEYIMELEEEEQFKVVCRNMTSFLNCANEVIKEQTGFTLRELASLLQGTDVGKALTVLANIGDLVDEVCTEGTQLHDDYVANIPCYRNIENNVPEECQQQAKDAYEAFKDIESERAPNHSRQQQIDESCVVAAYQVGCLGAAVHEECGDEGFNTFKEIVRKIGFFKSGMCPSEVMNTIKTNFVDSLDISDSRKSLYRVIFDLRKRRK